jgi:hypothetical protein
MTSIYAGRTWWPEPGIEAGTNSNSTWSEVLTDNRYGPPRHPNEDRAAGVAAEAWSLDDFYNAEPED